MSTKKIKSHIEKELTRINTEKSKLIKELSDKLTQVVNEFNEKHDSNESTLIAPIGFMLFSTVLLENLHESLKTPQHPAIETVCNINNLLLSHEEISKEIARGIEKLYCLMRFLREENDKKGENKV